MTGLEKTLEKLGAYPDFFQGDKIRIEKIILTPDFHKGAGHDGKWYADYVRLRCRAVRC